MGGGGQREQDGETPLKLLNSSLLISITFAPLLFCFHPLSPLLHSRYSPYSALLPSLHSALFPPLR